jgi:hypothetical protein
VQANMLSAITTYIPTEILTLYVAVRAALASPPATVTATATVMAGGVNWPEWYAFWGFLAVTPIVVWIVFATKLRAAHHWLPVSPGQWPWWEMFAATVAYVAWAFGLPNSVFNLKPWYSAAVGSVVVLVTSTFLGIIAPLVSRSR